MLRDNAIFSGCATSFFDFLYFCVSAWKHWIFSVIIVTVFYPRLSAVRWLVVVVLFYATYRWKTNQYLGWVRPSDSQPEGILFQPMGWVIRGWFATSGCISLPLVIDDKKNNLGLFPIYYNVPTYACACSPLGCVITCGCILLGDTLFGCIFRTGLGFLPRVEIRFGFPFLVVF